MNLSTSLLSTLFFVVTSVSAHKSNSYYHDHDYYHDHNYHHHSCKGKRSIIDVICDRSGHQYLCEAMIHSGLDGFYDKEDYLTVFAPKDSAFHKLGGKYVNGLYHYNNWELENLLLFHTTYGEYYYQDLSCDGWLKMANGDKSYTKCDHRSTYQKGRGNNNHHLPEIVYEDIYACNGVIHIVDHVMKP